MGDLGGILVTRFPTYACCHEIKSQGPTLLKSTAHRVKKPQPIHVRLGRQYEENLHAGNHRRQFILTSMDQNHLHHRIVVLTRE